MWPGCTGRVLSRLEGSILHFLTVGLSSFHGAPWEWLGFPPCSLCSFLLSLAPASFHEGLSFLWSFHLKHAKVSSTPGTPAQGFLMSKTTILLPSCTRRVSLPRAWDPPKYGPQAWAPIMGSKHGPQAWAPSMGPKHGQEAPRQTQGLLYENPPFPMFSSSTVTHGTCRESPSASWEPEPEAQSLFMWG